MGEDVNALNNIGCIYLGQGKHEEAVSSFEKAIKLKTLGYEAYVKRINAQGKETWYRVLVGRFQKKRAMYFFLDSWFFLCHA